MATRHVNVMKVFMNARSNTVPDRFFLRSVNLGIKASTFCFNTILASMYIVCALRRVLWLHRVPGNLFRFFWQFLTDCRSFMPTLSACPDRLGKFLKSVQPSGQIWVNLGIIRGPKSSRKRLQISTVSVAHHVACNLFSRACYSFLYVFSFSWSRRSAYIQLQNGIDDIIIIFEQGKKAYKQQRAEVMDTLRQNNEPRSWRIFRWQGITLGISTWKSFFYYIFYVNELVLPMKWI